VGNDALEELQHDTVRVLLLELTCIRLEHGERAVACLVEGMTQQDGLADPRVSRDQERAAPAGAGGVDGSADARSLGFPLDERHA
jgi:hypothetical protein